MRLMGYAKIEIPICPISPIRPISPIILISSALPAVENDNLQPNF